MISKPGISSWHFEVLTASKLFANVQTSPMSNQVLKWFFSQTLMFRTSTMLIPIKGSQVLRTHHDSFAVTTQGILQQLGQRGVPERH